MKHLLYLLLLSSSLACADEIGSQYQAQAEAGDSRAQYLLAETWYSSGNDKQAEVWAEKAATGGDVAMVAWTEPTVQGPRVRAAWLRAQD